MYLKKNKGNIPFLAAVITVTLCIMVLIGMIANKRQEYYSITPNKIYEERTGDAFKRKQITIIDRRDNYIKFRMADGSEMTMPFDNFSDTFKEYKKDNISN